MEGRKKSDVREAIKENVGIKRGAIYFTLRWDSKELRGNVWAEFASLMMGRWGDWSGHKIPESQPGSQLPSKAANPAPDASTNSPFRGRY